MPKIIKAFNDSALSNLLWSPHFTSVINWMQRLGLGLLNQVKKLSQPFLAIVDHSISIGTRKVMVVLRVPVNVIEQKQSALSLADCECIGLQVSEKINGEIVGQQLKRIFDKTGKPVAIIKDREACLNKGARSVSTEQEPIALFDDIGHVCASGLKAEFAKDESFKSMIAIARDGARCLNNTPLACFIPPKLRTKGRWR